MGNPRWWYFAGQLAVSDLGNCIDVSPHREGRRDKLPTVLIYLYIRRLSSGPGCEVEVCRVVSCSGSGGSCGSI